MAIGTDVTIDYANRIFDTTVAFSSGKPSTIYSMREFYQHVQNVWDEPAQMDEETALSAQTPNEYTILNGWFATEDLIKTLFGGALQTDGWTRNVTNAGIVAIAYGGTTHPAPVDIGSAITSTDGDAGVLLDYSTERNVMWIRPDSTAAADNFDSSAGNLAIGTTEYPHTTFGAQSGEYIWRNLFSLGTIEAQTELYVMQVNDRFEVTGSTKSELTAVPWWDEDVSFVDPTGSGGAETGHLDILVKIREADAFVDNGYLEVLGRQYSKLYDFFSIQTTVSGRSPIPLSIGDDLNNTSGVRRLDSTGSSGFTSGTTGQVFASTGDRDNTAVITRVTTGVTTGKMVDYYLIGNRTGFSAGDVVALEGSTANHLTLSATTGPENIGPSTLSSAVVVTFGNSSALDIDQNGVNENYAAIIDLNGNTVSDMYQNLKFRTGRGSTEDLDNGGQVVQGQFYTGLELRLEYDAESTTPFVEGDVVEVAGSTLNRGVVAAIEDNGTSGHFILYNTRGSFSENDVLQADDSTNDRTITSTQATLAIVKAMPFGSFAGGVFFGARGVGLSSVAAADAQNYQTINTSGESILPPNIVNISVTNLAQEDRVAIYKLEGSGSSISKSTYIASSGNTSAASTISIDTPEIIETTRYPSTGGTLKVVTTQGREDRYSYSSYALNSGEFVLKSFTTGASTVADAAGTQLNTGAASSFVSTGVEVGMIVKNQETSAIAQITEVVDEFVLTHTPFSETTLGSSNNWAIGDGYEINRTVEAYSSNATIYPSVMDYVVSTVVAGTTSRTESIVFASTFTVSVRVRSGSTGSKIVPFVTEGEVGSGGLSVRAVRTADAIAST